jgi:preprotein translocase subunit SecA
VGDPIEQDPPRYRQRVDRVRALESDIVRLGADELRADAASVAQRLRSGDRREEGIARAFALVAEACRRALALSPFDEQPVAAFAMHDGHIAQMDTGEGKTLAAVFPAFVWGALGAGAHVLTFNDYLARRDAAWMGPIYELLGLTVGHVEETSTDGERRESLAGRLAQLIESLDPATHYREDEYARAVDLTDEGLARAEEALGSICSTRPTSPC